MLSHSQDTPQPRHHSAWSAGGQWGRSQRTYSYPTRRAARAACYFEQINAFDCRCGHEHPCRSLDEVRNLHVRETIYL